MAEPTQEQLRTEAYWRSTISAELYDEAARVLLQPENRSLGTALATVIEHAGNKVGRMPDRLRVFDREPPPDVTVVYDVDGDEWRRTEDGWSCGAEENISFPDIRDSYGPITARPSGGA